MTDLSPELISKLEKLLRLPFVNQSSTEGNLCFVNDPEVRPEFKETFNLDHVLYYLKAVEQSQHGTDDHFQLPADRNQFWKMVKIGEDLSHV